MEASRELDMTADQIARDFCGVINDVPVVFTFSGTEYEGTRGALVQSKRVVEGGIFEEPELAISTCLKKVNSSGKLVDRFASDAPGPQNVLSSVGGDDDRNYRIVKTHRDEWDMVLQMDLESIRK